jgi:hypothetical protein
MPTARVSEKTRRLLREISERSGESMQTILEKAVEAYRRKVFLEQANNAYEKLRATSEAWREEEAERREWERVVADGLQED